MQSQVSKNGKTLVVPFGVGATTPEEALGPPVYPPRQKALEGIPRERDGAGKGLCGTDPSGKKRLRDYSGCLKVFSFFSEHVDM